MIELNKYDVTCSHCGKDTVFTVNDVDGLAADIEDEVEEATGETRKEVEREFDGMVDPDDLPVRPETIRELAAAIQQGNRDEATRLIRSVADDLGVQHLNAFELGRFDRAMVRA